MGRRLVLRYPLEHKQPGPVCRAIPLTQEILKLQSILTSWTKQKDQITHEILAYVLNDKYDDKKLEIIEFSNSDQLAVTQLVDACAEAGFSLFLSTLSARIVSRKTFESDQRIRSQADRPGSSWNLGRIVDFEGKELLGNYRMGLKKEDIVQDRAFDGDDYVIDEECDYQDQYLTKLFRKTVGFSTFV